MYEWLFAAPGSVPPAWDPDAAARRLAAAIAAVDSTILVAEAADGGLAGICSCYLAIESVRHGQRCWVEDLAVDPARRSQGIGAVLMAAARAWASERGATHLELDSGKARTDAHRFYEREGPAWTGTQFAWLL